MSYFYPNSKEEWNQLLHEFYSDSNTPCCIKGKQNPHLYMERKCLPGLSLIQVQNVFPYDISWKSRIEEALFSMNFMLKGDLKYSLEEKNSEIKEGENNVLIMPKNTAHVLQFAANAPYSYRSCVLKQDYLENLVLRYPDQLGELYSEYKKEHLTFLSKNNLIVTSEILMIISQIDQAFELGKTKNMYIEGKILELLSLQINYWHSCHNSSKIPSDELEKIRKAEYILISSVGKPPSVPALAAMVGLNSYKLKNGFKLVYSNTVFGHLLIYRMNKARHLLQNSELSILEVGMECGYEHSSHFCKAFKRKFGVTALQFRNRN